jgi:hypothetical protein
MPNGTQSPETRFIQGSIRKTRPHLPGAGWHTDDDFEGGCVTAQCPQVPRGQLTLPRAIASFVPEVKGEEHFVHPGEVLPPSHPVVKARPELFEPENATSKPTRARRSHAKTI